MKNTNIQKTLQNLDENFAWDGRPVRSKEAARFRKNTEKGAGKISISRYIVVGILIGFVASVILLIPSDSVRLELFQKTARSEMALLPTSVFVMVMNLIGRPRCELQHSAAFGFFAGFAAFNTIISVISAIFSLLRL